MDKSRIGIKFKRLREQKTDYLVEEVALICEISTAELVDIEKGKRYPNEKTLALLLHLYKVTEIDFHRNDFIDHNKRKALLNYIQLGIAILLPLAYFLPFEKMYYGGQGEYEAGVSGFAFLFNGLYRNPNVISVLFLLLLFQVLLHILLYTKFKKYSNVFKIIFFLIDVPAILLFYIDFTSYDNMEWTMWTFILLLLSHIALTIYDLLLYPLEHDFKTQKGTMRRWFLLFINIAYVITFTWIIVNIIRHPYDMYFIEYVFFGLWAGYLLTYMFMKKSLFELRKNVTIMLLIPPTSFAIFLTVLFGLIIKEEYVYEPGNMFLILFLFLPPILINVDYFIDLARERFTKGDIKEL